MAQGDWPEFVFACGFEDFDSSTLLLTYYINPYKEQYESVRDNTTHPTPDETYTVELIDGVFIDAGASTPYANPYYSKYWFPDTPPYASFYRLNRSV